MKHVVLALALCLAPVASAQSLTGTDLTLDRGGATGFTLKAKGPADPFPVPTFRPLQNNRLIALDLMPSGTPAESSLHGFAWIDVCNRDQIQYGGGVACARVGARSMAMEFGSNAFGGETLRPIWFSIQSQPAMVISTDRQVGVGTQTPAVPLDVSGLARAISGTQPACTQTIAGAFYFDTTARAFFGCDGTTWKRLDNE